MNRRNLITALLTAPFLAAAAQEKLSVEEIQLRSLISAMVEFDHEWTDLVNTFVDKKGDAWDMKQAGVVERAFKRLVGQPGWISLHKI